MTYQLTATKVWRTHAQYSFNRAAALLNINGDRGAFHNYCASLAGNCYTLAAWGQLYDAFVKDADAEDEADTQRCAVEPHI